MADVVDFTGITRLPSDPQRVLEKALSAGMKSVVVIGFDADGGEYFGSSDADGGSVIWHLERAKLKLLRVADGHE
jgi:hypothetical protein